MIIFAIPFRGKESTNNWSKCEQSLNQTIASIFNQTNENFKCIVACNEMPRLAKEYDDRLEFIIMDIPVPNTWIEMARDKFWKLTRIAVRCREILEEQVQPEKGIYVMPVDADDLISNRISDYCESYPDENGFYSEFGYVHYGSEKKLHTYKELHRFCGSCNIIKMYREDLPIEMPYPDIYCHNKEVAAELNQKYPIRYDHHVVVDVYAAKGKEFKVLPFKSTIYMRDNGDNISAIYLKENKKEDGRRFHPVAFIRHILEVINWRPITKNIQREYNYPSL